MAPFEDPVASLLRKLVGSHTCEGTVTLLSSVVPKNRTETVCGPRVDRSFLDTWFGKLERTGLMSGETSDVSAAFLSGMPTDKSIRIRAPSCGLPSVGSAQLGRRLMRLAAAQSYGKMLLRVHVGFFDQAL